MLPDIHVTSIVILAPDKRCAELSAAPHTRGGGRLLNPWGAASWIYRGHLWDPLIAGCWYDGDILNALLFRPSTQHTL